MLYLETSTSPFPAWAGEPINGIRYPRAIATKWSDEDLAAIGLCRPAAADPVPEGKIVTGQSVQRVEGVVKWVYDLADAPEPIPHYPPLTARQLRLGLIQAGVSIASVDAAISAIPDEMDRETARVEWEYASQFERDHALIEEVGAALGLTPEQIDAAWLAAVNL